MQNLKYTAGFSMVQVIVTVFILSAGISAGANVLVNAIITNRSNQQRLMATNLAQEVIEVVRNMRDSNYLNNSTELRGCWNFWEDVNEDGTIDATDDACSVTNGQNNHPWGLNNAGTYPTRFRVNQDSDLHWVLEEVANDTEAKLYKNSDDLYTHEVSADPADSTIFSRTIEIYYPDNGLDVNGFTGGKYPLGDPKRDNRILLRARVWWQGGNREQQVVLTTVLTDFYGRTGWED